MFSKFAVFTAGLAALAAAAPMPQVSQTTNWQSVWSSQQEGFKSQLSSMISVQSAMGQADPTAAATSALASAGVGSAPSAAAGGAAPTTTVFHTNTIKASVTSTRNDASQITAPADGTPPKKEVVGADGGAQVAPALTGAVSKPSAGASIASIAQVSAASAPSSSTTQSTPATENKAASGQGPAVTNSAAWNGQASSGPAPADNYKCYGQPGNAPASSFPGSSHWGSFDALYQQNYKLLQQGCANLGYSPNNNDQQIGWIKNSIAQVASDARVDPRVILATVMQESHGCLAVGTTSNGVTNPGLMQSHNGASFVGNGASPAAQQASITQMIRDGTQGTASGDGLVQLVNRYGDVYTASRAYNSGDRGTTRANLNLGNGATKTYVNDIANRLTGWVFNPGTSPSCPGEQ